ncbi:rhomboid-like protein 14, mitochondrial [Rhododendron vialii]|uniref:rhomboid-like protein 14, mitochondrial n=1 Tax=Rhododendron vialii TaxID=182163 RepID=UPI00265DCA9F|nr:rhomboid-like protein 14, mitochondrial [Rhododendron vialii]
MEGGGRRSRGLLPILAVHAVSEYWRLDRKPPVTAALVAANTLVYLRPGVLDRVLPTIDQVWFNPYLILKHRDVKRLFLSAFYHVGESHLVYNMMSLLWKGIQLESSMGSSEFASMAVTLLGLSQGVTLLLSKSLLLFFDYGRPYYREYAVGFSGVLFAMKVVLNSQSDYSNIHGLIIPSRLAAWAELILIQVLVPDASFIGHLGGILAGILYLKLKSSYSGGSDPLTVVIRGLVNVVTWPSRFLRQFGLCRRRRITGRGTVGRDRGSASGVWRCEACTFDNSTWLNECEMCGTRRGGNGLSFLGSSDDPRVVPLEELRRRRVQRFNLR